MEIEPVLPQSFTEEWRNNKICSTSSAFLERRYDYQIQELCDADQYRECVMKIRVMARGLQNMPAWSNAPTPEPQIPVEATDETLEEKPSFAHNTRVRNSNVLSGKCIKMQDINESVYEEKMCSEVLDTVRKCLDIILDKLSYENKLQETNQIRSEFVRNKLVEELVKLASVYSKIEFMNTLICRTLTDVICSDPGRFDKRNRQAVDYAVSLVRDFQPASSAVIQALDLLYTLCLNEELAKYLVDKHESFITKCLLSCFADSNYSWAQLKPRMQVIACISTVGGGSQLLRKRKLLQSLSDRIAASSQPNAIIAEDLSTNVWIYNFEFLGTIINAIQRDGGRGSLGLDPTSFILPISHVVSNNRIQSEDLINSVIWFLIIIERHCTPIGNLDDPSLKFIHHMYETSKGKAPADIRRALAGWISCGNEKARLDQKSHQPSKKSVKNESQSRTRAEKVKLVVRKTIVKKSFVVKASKSVVNMGNDEDEEPKYTSETMQAHGSKRVGVIDLRTPSTDKYSFRQRKASNMVTNLIRKKAI